MTPVQYYRGNPGELLSIRDGKVERARMLRKERNMMKGGDAAGVVNLLFLHFVQN